MIDYDPCLFRVSSQYKSSRQMLLYLARALMSGEG